MRAIEIRTAVQYSYLALGRPNWWREFLRRGREGLLREMVSDSVEILRREPAHSLKEILSTPPKTPLGRMGAPQEYLYRLVRTARPAVLVETGVYRGISSAFMLAALQDNDHGHLFSIDLPSGSYVNPSSGLTDSSPLFNEEQVGFVVPDEVRERWTLRLGDARAELPLLLAKLPSVDLFYHDSEHTYDMMMWEYEQVIPHISAGGLLTSDDTNWNSAFEDFARRHGLRNSCKILGRLGVATVRQAPPAT
jgi:hypothetical protein